VDAISRIIFFDGLTADRNTLKIGVVVVTTAAR
jgi:hypothetical protein